MPLTRGAARLLRVEVGLGVEAGVEAGVEGTLDEGDSLLSRLALRDSVAAKADAVWARRGGVDAYSRNSRAQTERPQVDHALEVQLCEFALVRTLGAESVGERGAGSIGTTQATEMMRGAFNGLDNLNVTSARTNQSKKGPFTAAINRLSNDRLRNVSIEQLARQGRARWLVDNGDWIRIESTVVAAFDHCDAELRGSGIETALPAAARLVDGTLDELHAALNALGIT